MLTLHSTHSVRGGIGRSSFACELAKSAARDGKRAFLVELDLTGTSIVDRKEVEAPRWPEGQKVNASLFEGQLPTGFWSVSESMDRVRERSLLRKIQPSTNRFVPFINDFLLHSPSHWDAENEAKLEGILWRYVAGKDPFFVIPVSPLPVDAHHIDFLVVDEDRGAFIEGRLEWLLSFIAAQGDATVVFDCPRGFHGLSRTVLSLGIRLSKDKKVPLSQDGFMPRPLEDTPITWEGSLLYRTPSDQVALERWLNIFTDDERKHVKMVRQW